MTKHSFTVLIENDEDGVFIGTVPSLKGCYSYGKTLDELMANLKEAIEAHHQAFEAEDFLNLFTAELTKSAEMR
jgi:predicted RNase H-like HicB family nuclease